MSKQRLHNIGPVSICGVNVLNTRRHSLTQHLDGASLIIGRPPDARPGQPHRTKSQATNRFAR
ncbi:hypothetical protein PSCICO_02780 [Pseudomonas cichorii]|nr:hypothetical protein PSCICO_02780 [Pseudomonas cichorii]